MRRQQHILPRYNQQERKKLIWRYVFFCIIIIGALAITAVWILSGLSIIPSPWAIILSAIVTVLGVVIGLCPLIFLPKKSELSPVIQSEPLTPQNAVQLPNGSSNIQNITAIRHSQVIEPEQTIRGRGGINKQTIEASDNSEISYPRQNITFS